MQTPSRILSLLLFAATSARAFSPECQEPAQDSRIVWEFATGTVYALDAASGAVAWKQALNFRISTSIAVFGASGYVGTIAGRLYRLDLTIGAVSADLPLDGRAEGKLTVCGKSLLGYLGNQGLFALEAQDKKIRWTQLAAKEWTSARPYCSGGSVLVGDHDTLTVFRASDGTPLGTRKFPGTLRGIGIYNALERSNVQARLSLEAILHRRATVTSASFLYVYSFYEQ